MLRNAFEGVATEGTLRRLLNALNYAKDLNDRMRVVVDTMPTTTVTGTVTAVTALNGIAFGSSNVAPAHFASGAPNAFDAREQQMILMRSNFQQARTQRWTFS